jgi:hypothetical protein
VNFPQHEGQEQAVKQAPARDMSKVRDVTRRSKFVGVSWDKVKKKWKANIRIDGKQKTLGYFDNEKEAACKYDEQAALLNKPVNFPQHEGQEQAVKPAPGRVLSKVQDVTRRSKFVGVSWDKVKKKWEAQITINGKNKHLGYFHDEKEAACKYDEQAALLNKSVNFPQHEGQEQAVKKAPAGSGPKRKSRAKSSKDGHDGEEEEEEEEEEEAMDEDSDDEEDGIIMDDHQQTTASSHTPTTFLQHLVQQRAAFLQVKQELTDDLHEATQAAQQAQDSPTDDGHFCVVCMERERGVL